MGPQKTSIRDSIRVSISSGHHKGSEQVILQIRACFGILFTGAVPYWEPQKGP